MVEHGLGPPIITPSRLEAVLTVGRNLLQTARYGTVHRPTEKPLTESARPHFIGPSAPDLSNEVTGNVGMNRPIIRSDRVLSDDSKELANL